MTILTVINWDYYKHMIVESQAVTIAGDDGGLMFMTEGVKVTVGFYDGVVHIMKVDAFGTVLSKVAVKDL